MDVPAAGMDYTFSAPSYASSLLTGLRDYRHRRELCDITLCTEEKELDAHRIVLACFSPYFSAMFKNEHKESSQQNVFMQGIDSEALSDLISYAYSSSLTINASNVQNLLAAASLLQITSVVEACCRFLQANLDVENCLGIAYFAEMHSCSHLYKQSWQFVLENFSEVSQCDEFLTVPDSYLKELVKSENLNVRSEEQVLNCVLEWLDHDRAARIKTVTSILQYVKLPLISRETISDRLLGDPALSLLPECLTMVSALLQPKAELDKQVLDVFEHSKYIPRRSSGQSTMFYVIGGETVGSRSSINTIQQFSTVKNTWIELGPMAVGRRGMGVATLDSYVYAIGGSDGVKSLSLVERYDPATDSWTCLTSLNQARSSVSAAVVNNQLYAIGGYDGVTSCLNLVERYDPLADSWTYVTPMNHQRSMTAIGVLNNLLYVIGGYDGASDLSSCEVYNPDSDTWSEVPAMQCCRCMSGVAVINGQLFVVGGCDCSLSLDSVEVFDPEKNQWRLGPKMSECRSGLGVVAVGSKLYAIGGYTGSECLNSVVCYDPKQDDGWSFVAPMVYAKRRFGCCS